MKYGIIVNGRVTEPVSVPEGVDAIAWLGVMFPGVTEWVVVPAYAVPGTIANDDGTFEEPQTSDTPKPRILSKTAFQDYAVSILGGGIDGMTRFTEIIDATRDHANGAVRFAFARYEAANTFEKENTALLTLVMQTYGTIEEAERDAILNGWPV